MAGPGNAGVFDTPPEHALLAWSSFRLRLLREPISPSSVRFARDPHHQIHRQSRRPEKRHLVQIRFPGADVRAHLRKVNPAPRPVNFDLLTKGIPTAPHSDQVEHLGAFRRAIVIHQSSLVVIVRRLPLVASGRISRVGAIDRARAFLSISSSSIGRLADSSANRLPIVDHAVTDHSFAGYPSTISRLSVDHW